jgi:hypothetical protein
MILPQDNTRSGCAATQQLFALSDRILVTHLSLLLGEGASKREGKTRGVFSVEDNREKSSFSSSCRPDIGLSSPHSILSYKHSLEKMDKACLLFSCGWPCPGDFIDKSKEVLCGSTEVMFRNKDPPVDFHG